MSEAYSKVYIDHHGGVGSLGKRPIVNEVQAIVEPIIDNLGLELVEVQYAKEGPNWVLRLTIDGPNGIGHDECLAVNRAVNQPLDEADPIPGAYSLEVSSPGLDRPLRKPADFVRFAGNEVRVSTYGPIDGRKNWRGMLQGLEDDEVVLTVDGEEVRLPFDKVSRTRLVPDI